MFSKGQIIFAVLFFIAFVVGISFAYFKDKSSNKDLFKGSYKILVFILFVFIALFVLVKVKHLIFP
jgi:hypothetical protein